MNTRGFWQAVEIIRRSSCFSGGSSNTDRWKRAQSAELEYAASRTHAFSFSTTVDWLKLVGWSADVFRGKKVLEIGSGPFGIIFALDSAAKRVSVDPLNLEYAKYGYKHGLDRVVGKGEALPFGPEIFDAVILRNVLDHVQVPKDVLSETCRVLRRGGKLYFMCNIFPQIGFVLRILDRLDRPHPFHFTMRDCLGMFPGSLKFLTLVVKESGGFSRISDFAGMSGWRRLVGRILKEELYVVAEKHDALVPITPERVVPG